MALPAQAGDPLHIFLAVSEQSSSQTRRHGASRRFWGKPGSSDPSNPLGHFTASFPTPATFGAQAIQAPFQANGSGARFPWSGHPGANALVPPAVARQTFQSAREPPPPLPAGRHPRGCASRWLPPAALRPRATAPAPWCLLCAWKI